MKHAISTGKFSLSDETYFSPDIFLYSLCVPIVIGKDYYTKVLENPSEMPKGIDFERLLYVASEAFEKKTGNDFEPDTDFSYETFSNEAGWLNTEL